MSQSIPDPTAIDMSKLSDQELTMAIRNLRLLLDMHFDERLRRIHEKQVAAGKSDE
jgi:hypothetical protein